MVGNRPDFQALFKALSVPYAVMDRDFRYVALNNLVEEIVGRPHAELVGKSLFDLFPEIEERQSIMEDAFHAAFAGTPTSMTDVPYRLSIPGRPGEMRELWWTFHCHPIPVKDGPVQYIGFHAENITAQVRARELNTLISEELRHRVKNTLSLVQVIAHQTASGYKEVDTFIDSFDDRIVSLAKTHDMLTGTNWDGLSFEVLLNVELDAKRDLVGSRIFLKGQPLSLSATEAQALSMALHELMSNAVKHGALSRRGGEIHIEWQLLSDDGYAISWTESGMAERDVPDEEGFGSVILNRILPAQIGGKANHRFTADSHAYTIMVEKRRSRM